VRQPLQHGEQHPPAICQHNQREAFQRTMPTNGRGVRQRQYERTLAWLPHPPQIPHALPLFGPQRHLSSRTLFLPKNHSLTSETESPRFSQRDLLCLRCSLSRRARCVRALRRAYRRLATSAARWNRKWRIVHYTIASYLSELTLTPSVMTNLAPRQRLLKLL